MILGSQGTRTTIRQGVTSRTSRRLARRLDLFHQLVDVAVGGPEVGAPVPCVDGHLVVGWNAGGAQLGRGRIDVVDEETDGPTVAACGARTVGGADREGRAVGQGEEVMPGALDRNRGEPRVGSIERRLESATAAERGLRIPGPVDSGFEVVYSRAVKASRM